MLVNDVILEKHYKGPLYHVTVLSYAEKILEEQRVILTNAGGSDIELNYQNPKKPQYHYFFSTSRSKIHAYRKRDQIELYKKATFVIDPSKLPRNVAFAQVNYWGSKHAAYPIGQESEERIWSDQEELPINFIIETHVLETDLKLKQAKKDIIYIAKLSEEKNNIPCYIYDNNNSYALLNKRKAHRMKDLLSDENT